MPGGLGRAQHGPAHPPPDRPRHLQREPARLHQAQDQTQEEAQVRAVRQWGDGSLEGPPLPPAVWQELLSCELLAVPTAFLFIVLVLKKPSSLKSRMAGGRVQFSTWRFSG